MSGPFVVFDLLIPRTDDRTGVVHPPSLFEDWTIETAERFGGITQLAADILGFWFDSKDLVEDHSHWYRVAVSEGEVVALREHVKATARRSGSGACISRRVVRRSWSGPTLCDGHQPVG